MIRKFASGCPAGLIALFCAAVVAIRSARAESFFSVRGLGEAWGAVDAGHAGLSALGPSNPAYGLVMPGPTFTATLLAECLVGREPGASRTIGDVVPMNVAGYLPLPWDIGVRVGLGERFNQDFSVYSDSAVTDSISYRRHIAGSGGIDGATFGLGKEFFHTLALGADYTWFFGSSVEEWGIEIFSGSYLTKDTAVAVFSGGNFKAGASIRTRLFTLAGFYETPVGLSVKTRIRSAAQVESSANRISTPGAWSAGLSVNGPRNTRAFVDYRSEPWAGSDTILGFVNGSGLCAGFELTQVPLAVGYRNRTWPFNSILDKKIVEQSVFVQSGIPIRTVGRFNFALEFLYRGDGALTETGFRLMTSLSFEEPWKRRARRWGGG